MGPWAQFPKVAEKGEGEGEGGEGGEGEGENGFF